MSSIKPDKWDKPLFALVDCNNFYASCERVFNPQLVGQPIVVLSNNDGCVIARSNEAKALNIPMGAPFFQYQDFFKRNRVFVFSSNFTLYGDMSQRVMQTLAQFSQELEIYSIDEAFLQLERDQIAHAQKIKRTVYQWTGIPVSIGIAPTKTLAKIANRHAKKYFPEGVFILNEESVREKVLKALDVQDVWGIVSQMSVFFYRNRIRTAWELACIDDRWIQKNLSITALRTVWELRGISCLTLEEAAPPKKSIVCSRSFSSPIFREIDLAEALSSYVSSAAEKLRGQASVASYLEVFLNTSRFKEEYYSNSIHITLPIPTDYTPTLIQSAKQGLHKLYRKDLAYKKVGILLGGIISNQAIQQDLFVPMNPKCSTLMQLMDQTNAKYGKDTLKFAAQGTEQPWKRKCKIKMMHFTTSWEDLLQINI